MLLVDSTVWVSVERGNADVTTLQPLEDLAVCPAIIHEVLRGATTQAQREFARSVMMAALIVDSPTPLERFEEAATLYLRCRAAGYTTTGFDCLIASSALAHDAEIVHADADFERIQQVEPRLRLRHI